MINGHTNATHSLVWEGVPVRRSVCDGGKKKKIKPTCHYCFLTYVYTHCVLFLLLMLFEWRASLVKAPFQKRRSCPLSPKQLSLTPFFIILPHLRLPSPSIETLTKLSWYPTDSSSMQQCNSKKTLTIYRILGEMSGKQERNTHSTKAHEAPAVSFFFLTTVDLFFPSPSFFAFGILNFMLMSRISVVVCVCVCVCVCMKVVLGSFSNAKMKPLVAAVKQGVCEPLKSHTFTPNCCGI